MPRRWLQGSAQGFNPGNPQNNEFALKLKGERLSGEPRTYCRLKVWKPWHVSIANDAANHLKLLCADD
jgi:hypothetical protein